MTVSEDPKLTMDDLAERLNSSRRTVIRLKDSGELPCYKVGKLVRFSESDFQAYLARSRRGDAAPVESEPVRPRRRRRTRKAVAA